MLRLLLIIAYASLGFSQMNCGPNEVFDTCGSACEPSCRNPNPTICTLQCVVGCRCRQGFFRDDFGQCVASCGRPSPPVQTGPTSPPSGLSPPSKPSPVPNPPSPSRPSPVPASAPAPKPTPVQRPPPTPRPSPTPAPAPAPKPTPAIKPPSPPRPSPTSAPPPPFKPLPVPKPPSSPQPSAPSPPGHSQQLRCPQNESWSKCPTQCDLRVAI
uniref:TIL domain-containing protein n=1 Tax=Haemonchus contortus TaxID=6289 RepID=A0A7I4Z5N6_HAECO